jgi:peptide-methionine (S)-S-oxide reductase
MPHPSLRALLRPLRRPLVGALLAVAAAGGSVALGPFAEAEEAPRRLPEATTTAHEDRGSHTAIFAGGCFWGVQGVFQNVRGVSSAVSGYAGGDRASADYRTVSTGRTRHAEAVRVTYDPATVRYDELLRLFFSVALDPTQVDRQGPDAGPQYRSALFPTDAEQARVARAYIAQLDAARTYARPIATRIEGQAAFFPAEEEHQDFMSLHPDHPYIVANDAPKLRALKRLFPDLAAPTPVLLSRSPT